MKRWIATSAAVLLGVAVVTADPADARDTGAQLASSVKRLTHFDRQAEVARHVPAAAASKGTGCAGAKTAAPTASTGTRAAIAEAAVSANPFLGAVPASKIMVSQVRWSGVYASAVLTPKGGSTDPAQVLLKHEGRRWVVKMLGTTEVGCELPSATRATLGFWGGCPRG